MIVRRASGFTLVEILVIVAIIGIIAAFAAAMITRAREVRAEVTEEDFENLTASSNLNVYSQGIATVCIWNIEKWPKKHKTCEIVQIFIDDDIAYILYKEKGQSNESD